MYNPYKKIKNLDKIRPGDHIVFLYEDKNKFTSTLVPFIKSSLERGEKCMYIEGDGDTELLLFKLNQEMNNFSRYIEYRSAVNFKQRTELCSQQ